MCLSVMFGIWFGTSGGENGKKANPIAMNCCGVGSGGSIGVFAGGRAVVEIVRPMLRSVEGQDGRV